MGAANVINSGYGTILRTAGWQQTDTGLLWIPPTMRIPSPPSDLGVTTMVNFREGVWLRRVELQNLNAGAINVGIGSRMGNPHWKFGRLSADGATYTDLTANAQSSVLTTTLGVAGADQTGFVALSDRPFDWMSINVSTAETNAGGGTVVDHTVQYSVAGAAWTTVSAAMTLTDNFTLTNTVLGTGAKNFVWEKQADWAKTSGHGDIPNGYYAIRVTSAEREAADVAAVATGIEIGEALLLKSLAAAGVWSMENLDYWMPAGDGIVAYFSDVTVHNRVYAEAISR